MNFTETTADTVVHVNNFRLTVFVRLDDFLWAECHTDSAGFTPVMIKRDIEMFLFIARCFPGRFYDGLFFLIALFSHAIPRKNSK